MARQKAAKLLILRAKRLAAHLVNLLVLLNPTEKMLSGVHMVLV